MAKFVIHDAWLEKWSVDYYFHLQNQWSLFSFRFLVEWGNEANGLECNREKGPVMSKLLLLSRLEYKASCKWHLLDQF